MSPSTRMEAAPPVATISLARERALVLVVAAVQLVNVLEFMIVMPLGPDFALALGFPVDSVGVLGAAYTGAGAVSGLAGALFLDRYDRRRVLIWSMAGLITATVLAGTARGLGTLVAARVLAGAFGGPATAISLAIVSDLVPPTRRGRAMSIVMGAFSVASIFGVPAALEAAGFAGWCAPFFAVAILATLVVAFARDVLPPMSSHIAGAASGPQGVTRLVGLVRRPEASLALAVTGLSMVSMFAIVPNLSAYMQFNGGWPRERLSLLYFLGGLASLSLMAMFGRVIDRLGAAPVVALSAVWVSITIAVGVVPGHPLLPVPLFFVLFMGGSSIRGVAVGALVSRVPPPHERAGYQSAQSATQHLACAIGALASTLILHARPDGTLENMGGLGVYTMVVTLLVPLIALAVERRVRAREREAGASVSVSASPQDPVAE